MCEITTPSLQAQDWTQGLAFVRLAIYFWVKSPTPGTCETIKTMCVCEAEFVTRFSLHSPIWDRVSLYSSGWPGSQNPPASTFTVLVIIVCWHLLHVVKLTLSATSSPPSMLGNKRILQLFSETLSAFSSNQLSPAPHRGWRKEGNSAFL